MHPDLNVTGLGVSCASSIDTTQFRQLLGGKHRLGCAAGEGFSAASLAQQPVLPHIIDFDSGDCARSARLDSAWHRADPACKSVLSAAAQAWFQAQVRCRADRVGVIVAGSNLNNREVFEQGLGRSVGKRVRPSYAADYFDSHYAGLLGEIFGIEGEGYAVGGASASGGVALALARRALLSGDADAVLVVAPPTLLSDAEIDAFIAIGALRRTASQPYQPFQRGCGGFEYREGACAMMVERADRSRSPGLALLSAASMVLRPNRSTHADANGEISAMQRALQQSGYQPCEIATVNAHATGTSQGDVIEAEAIFKVFEGTAPPIICATKALLGHWLCGAGIIEAVAAVLQVSQGFVPPNPFLTDPTDVRLNYAPQCLTKLPCKTVLSNSYGFAGIQTSQIFTSVEGR